VLASHRFPHHGGSGSGTGRHQRQVWRPGYRPRRQLGRQRNGKRGSGVIVNVLGNAAVRPSPNYIAGAAGNSSLVGFTKALGRESYDHGVRVVGINPGPIETERLVTLQKVHATKKFGDDSRWREMMSGGPGGRAGTSEECANVVAFLASDKASWVNGVVFSVDGGGSLR
jgi:NAD(P)-dependent dehydrogenase (short-subunit alcohol dehydrogenase family)